jgi:hypothetical protein
MFSDREELQTELVGQLRLFQQIAHPLLRTDAGVEVGESDESQIH